ncbi:MAG TPA: hypothetical protein VEY50_12585 [Lysobacter sp.]|nr:hypothetical protein [Lysobacter sp.]
MASDMQHGSGRRRHRASWAVWGTAALILLLPAVAMQFTDEVNWDETDFIVMGALLFAACGTYELAARTMRDGFYRAGVGVAVVAAFLLVWINLAVGIINSEDDPANLVFGGVLGVGLVGALIARFRPHGMARGMVAVAIAQGLAALFALWMGQGEDGLLAAAIFVPLWLTSAYLFGKAAERGQRAAGVVGTPR